MNITATIKTRKEIKQQSNDAIEEQDHITPRIIKGRGGMPIKPEPKLELSEDAVLSLKILYLDEMITGEFNEDENKMSPLQKEAFYEFRGLDKSQKQVSLEKLMLKKSGL